MNEPSRTPEAILADMEAMMKTSNHADYKAASNLQLSAELQTLLSASADATSRRNLRIANISLAIAIIALAISATQLLVSLRPATPPVPPAPDQAAVDLYQRQVKAAEDQLVRNEKQMRSAEDILQRQGAVMLRSEQQATQMEALTKQWEQQATRYDTILTRWEQQPAPPPQPPKQQ